MAAGTRWGGCHRGRSRGFTLVEMVLVVVIIGILSALAVPRFASSLANQRLEAVARRMATDLTYAQRQARLTSTPLKVSFNVARGYYTLENVTSLASSKAAYMVVVTDEPYKIPFSSVDFGGDAEVIFNGFGMPDSGGTIVVRHYTRKRTVALDAATGEVTIK